MIWSLENPACGLGFRWIVVMLLASPLAQADIRDTKHNLTGSPVDPDSRGRAEREICVFCHTPSLEDVGARDGASARPWPKWQRSVEAAFSFELFDDIGRGGVDAGVTGAVGSVSMACLSCHDGVQAFGVGTGSSSDHPFGVPYRGLVRGGEAATAYRDRLIQVIEGSPFQLGNAIRDDSEFKPARSAVVNRREIWWASVSSNVSQRSKNDLPLYPRRVVEGAGGGYEQVPFVECTSCHDPHSTREVFLRTTNESSKLCMTCHVK
jgi:predicted CXXCH cytochrome family protein